MLSTVRSPPIRRQKWRLIASPRVGMAGRFPRLLRLPWHLRRVPRDPHRTFGDGAEAQPIVQGIAGLRRAQEEAGSASVTMMLDDMLKQRAARSLPLMLGWRRHRPDPDRLTESGGLHAADWRRPLPRQEDR